MLTIRDAQLHVFEGPQFERAMIQHLDIHFPEQMQALGVDGAKRILPEIRARAAANGFNRQEDFWRYADLVFAFGLEFDRQQNWAREILEHPETQSPGTRIERLCQAALRHLDEVCAPAETADR